MVRLLQLLIQTPPPQGPPPSDGWLSTVLNWALGILVTLTTGSLVYLKTQCASKDKTIGKLAKELQQANLVIQEELRNQVKMAIKFKTAHKESFDDEI